MNIEEFMAGVESVATKRTGKISCSKCGARVTVSEKNYGGLGRVVCSNNECENSEGKAFN